MQINNNRIINEALREFYTASVGPLQAYQARLVQISNDNKALLVPYQAAVDAAEKDVNEKRRALSAATEAAVPELKKAYDAAFKDAWQYYDSLKAPYFQLRESGWQSAEVLYGTLVGIKVVDVDKLTSIGMGLDALYNNVDGKPESLSARDCTNSLARDILHETFLEAIAPLDKGRAALIRPTEEPYRKALSEAVASFDQSLTTAVEKLESAQKALQDARSKHYKELLQSRADARKECEQLLLPLKEQLKEKVRTAFENLSTR